MQHHFHVARHVALLRATATPVHTCHVVYAWQAWQMWQNSAEGSGTACN